MSENQPPVIRRKSASAGAKPAAAKTTTSTTAKPASAVKKTTTAKPASAVKKTTAAAASSVKKAPAGTGKTGASSASSVKKPGTQNTVHRKSTTPKQPLRDNVVSKGSYASDRRRRENTENPFARVQSTVMGIPQWIKLAAIGVMFVVVIVVLATSLSKISLDTERTVIMLLTPEPVYTPEPEATQEPVSVPSQPQTSDDSGITIETLTGTANTDDGQAANVPEATEIPSVTEIPAAPVVTAPPVLIDSADAKSVTIRVAGDIVADDDILKLAYSKVMDTYDFSSFFEYMGDTLSDADYTMINIDATLREGKYGYSGYPQFSTPPAILDTLKAQGIDMIMMCNNHMLDGYCDGLVESVGLVEQAGLDHIGGFVDEQDAATPEVYDLNGIKVAFVCSTEVPYDMENFCDERTHYLVKRLKNADFEGDIQACRDAGADVVIAVCHWGEEYQSTPESETRRYAERIVAAGADLILGNHPHMVQPAEYVTSGGRTALCTYSLGNFLTNHYKIKGTDCGVVFEFTLRQNNNGSYSVVAPGYIPVYVWRIPKSSDSYDYRLLPISQYLNNPPSGMGNDAYNRMKECWNETQQVLNYSNVIGLIEN